MELVSENPSEQQVAEFTDIILGEWVDLAKAVLVEQLKKKNLENSGELINSINSVNEKSSPTGNATASIIFVQYGRYLDLKRNGGKRLSKQVIEELIVPWVEKRGISKFNFVPGYSANTKSTIPDSEKINRIAWGIGKSFNKNKVRKGWSYSKKKGFLVRKLTADLTASYSEVILKTFKAA